MQFKKTYIIPIIAVVILATILMVLIKTGTPSSLSTEPVTSLQTGTQPSQDKIKLVSYNIHYGSGYYNSYIQDAEGEDAYTYLNQVADIIRDADIVTLQEADRSLKRSHFIDEAEYLAVKAGFKYYIFADNWNFRLFPFTKPVHFSRLRTGHAILSRYPITESHTIMFKKPSASLWHRMTFLWRTQQYADIDIDGTTLRLFNIHLESESRQDREDQAMQLADMARASPHPTILMGDFNALMPEATRKDFSGEEYRDDRTIATIRSAGLNELFPPEEYVKDESSFFTFTSKEPTRRLDYLYHSDDISIISANILDEPEASDHLPLAVEIGLEK